MNNVPTNRQIEALFRNIGYAIGNEIRREYEKSGKYTKSGIKYPNLPKRSSAPYESPTLQTGNLHSQIDVEYTNKEVTVGSKVKYLKYLELGTSKMLPRDGLNQAFNKIDKIEIIDKKVSRFFR